MNQWYLSKNGKAQGPLDEDKIISLIEQGEVGHLDLVFKAGNTEWTPVSEVEEFQSYLKKDEPAAIAANNDVEWVLLKKTKEKKGSQYTQLGPFSKNQVLDLIERGEVKFQDFAWRQGFDAWVPLGDLEEFSEPLPSTPKVDTDLYGPLNEDTQVDEEALSLTGLVEIEHFEHEKTQVMSSQDIPLNSSGFATETDVEAPPQSVSLPAEPSSESSLDQESIESEESHQTDADLWSLEPPDTQSKVNPKVSEKQKPKKKKTSKVKQKRDETKKAKRPTISLEESPWPWVAAACVLFLSVILLYISFSGPSEEYAEKEKVQKEFEQLSWEDEPVESEVSEAFEEDETLVSSQDPQLGMGSINTRGLSSSEKPKAKPKVKPVAKAKKAVKKKAAKKKVVKKVVKKKKSKKKKTSKKVTPKLASGSQKAKSFYKQRDRKALFYSSLKVESLIVEVERNFKKLKKNKKSWKKFYSRWKKKSRVSSLPSLVRKFPEKNNSYAYPKLIESFKRDHGLVSKYGAAYNARVLGLRRPAGAPKNLKNVFSKYRKQAQGLGK